MKTLKNIFLLGLLLLSFGSIAGECGKIQVPGSLLNPTISQAEGFEDMKICDVNESRFKNIKKEKKTKLDEFIADLKNKSTGCTCAEDKDIPSTTDDNGGLCRAARSFKVINGTEKDTFSIENTVIKN